jgi:hypothetical protein
MFSCQGRNLKRQLNYSRGRNLKRQLNYSRGRNLKRQLNYSSDAKTQRKKGGLYENKVSDPFKVDRINPDHDRRAGLRSRRQG